MRICTAICVTIEIMTHYDNTVLPITTCFVCKHYKIIIITMLFQ